MDKFHPPNRDPPPRRLPERLRHAVNGAPGAGGRRLDQHTTPTLGGLRDEREVIPEFYTRDQSGIPTAWVKRMRESMACLTPRFSASRAVREYTEQHYLPASTAYHLRIANKGAIGRQMVDWQHAVDRNWGSLRFEDLRVETNGGHHVFRVEVFLNDLDPNAVRVELYADGINGGDPVRKEMKCAQL